MGDSLLSRREVIQSLAAAIPLVSVSEIPAEPRPAAIVLTVPDRVGPEQVKSLWHYVSRQLAGTVLDGVPILVKYESVGLQLVYDGE